MEKEKGSIKIMRNQYIGIEKQQRKDMNLPLQHCAANKLDLSENYTL